MKLEKIRSLARAQTITTIERTVASLPEADRAKLFEEWRRTFPSAAKILDALWVTRQDPRAAIHLVDPRTGDTYGIEAGWSRKTECDVVEGWPEPTEPEPDEEVLERWSYDSVCEATDGCTVEPDGICEHGHPSWLLAKGLI